MVVPALGAAYLLAGPPRLGARPAARARGRGDDRGRARRGRSRSRCGPARRRTSAAATDGSAWDLILGYNGFGRIFGAGRRQAAAAALRRRRRLAGACSTSRSAGRSPGCSRSRPSSLVAGLWLTRRAPRTDLRRAASCSSASGRSCTSRSSRSQQGTFHPYYVSALAPAVAALAGVGLHCWWLGAALVGGRRGARPRRRRLRVARGRAAGPHAGLRALAADGDPGRRGDRALRARRAAPGAPAGAGRRARSRRSPSAPGRVLLGRQRRPGAQRQQRARRAVERRPGGRGGGGHGRRRDGRRRGRGGGSLQQRSSDLLPQANQGSATYLVAAVGSQTTRRSSSTRASRS